MPKNGRMQYTEKMKYIAFLRGIGPGNPNMTNDKLRMVFESLGFSDVRSVISSGNIIFTSSLGDQSKLEAIIQAGLQEKLGIPGGTIVRSENELRTFLATNPFGPRKHSKESYLIATFVKDRRFVPPFPIPHDTGYGSTVLSYNKEASALASVTDATRVKTPDFMVWLEKQCGKGITTRTWKTVERIVAKF